VEDEIGLIAKLVRARKLVVYGVTRFKVLGGTIEFTVSDGRWLAHDGPTVLALGESFTQVWEMAKKQVEAQLTETPAVLR
jgi:hypothetical protein